MLCVSYVCAQDLGLEYNVIIGVTYVGMCSFVGVCVHACMCVCGVSMCVYVYDIVCVCVCVYVCGYRIRV